MIILVSEQTGSSWPDWLQVVSGFLGTLVTALIAICLYRKQVQAQRDDDRKKDVREATASYIRSIRELIVATSLLDTDLMTYRSNVGIENRLYGMVVREELDRDKLYVLANVVIKSAGLARDLADGSTPPNRARRELLFFVSEKLIQALDDAEAGKIKPSALADIVWHSYEVELKKPEYFKDPAVRRALKNTGFTPYKPVTI